MTTNDDVLKEIEEMETLLDANTVPPGTDPPGTSPPGTDPPGTDAPGTVAPGTNAPGTQSPGTDAPSTDAPTTDAPTTDAPSELDILRDEVRELKEKLEKPRTEAPKTAAPTTAPPIETVDFIGDTDLFGLVEKKEDFNKLLNTLFKKAIEESRGISRQGQENVLKSIPEIVKRNLQVATSLKQVSDKFYEDNKDLEAHKKTVAEVFEKAMADNPDKSYGEVLGGIGDEVRQKLNLKKQAVKKDTKPKPPRRKGTQQRPKPKPNTGSLASEIADMDSALDE